MRAWGRGGVAVGGMGRFYVNVYTGRSFDTNLAVILPHDHTHLAPIWTFCNSSEFAKAVREIDKKPKVTPNTFVKVPFDLERWQRVAEENGPLPEPHSDDPTQWLFKGNPVGSEAPLQVAVARLLGYRWPEQPEGDEDGLGRLADADGIVCPPPVAGEQPAADRLRGFLAAAYRDQWSAALLDRLLAEVEFAGKNLATWLRDGFFAQHSKLFQNRPFIWHIWDGRKDGFSALVNYHKLDARRLEKLIYTYLGSWIAAQKAELTAEVAGAEGRYLAAHELQQKLIAIREGEPAYDVYVRWKPLHAQPIGWEPDLNDGVRLNIRPFVTAGVLRNRFTVNWNKDRGANPAGSDVYRWAEEAQRLAVPPGKPERPDGSQRLNDLHLTNEVKRRARREAGVA